MNSPVRATADMKADAAQPAPLTLSHTEATLADMRRDIVPLERRTTEPVPLDIAAARMRALAGRIKDARQEMRAVALRDDAALEAADTEIVPVSRSAIAGLRAFRAVATTDDDTKPAPLAVQGPPAGTSRAEIVAEASRSEFIGPLPRPASSESEAPPVLLRRADTQLERVTETPPLPTDVEFETRSVDGDHLPALLKLAEQNQLLEHLGDSAAPDGSNGETPSPDLRLVDLLRRQQTLLDQLNNYHGAPSSPEAVESPKQLPPSAPSVIDELAPTPSQIAPAQATQPTESQDAVEATEPRTADIAVPPPVPPALSTRREAPLDESVSQLPQRSPMIIERARAERAGRRGASEEYKPPSAFPAFAAGIAVALAIAGTLFYLL
jgi:hypothetical protein